MKFLVRKLTRKIELNARKIIRLQNIRYAKSFHPIRMPLRAYLEVLNERILSSAYQKVGSLKAEGYWSKEPLPFEKRFEGEKKDISIGVPWAKEVFDCAWFHMTGTMPKKGEYELAFCIDAGGEGLIFDRNGNPKQGITDYSSFFCYTLGLPYKMYVCADGLTDGDQVDFYIDCGANDLFGNFPDKCVASRFDIVELHPEIRSLYYDISVLLATCDINKSTPYYNKLYRTIRTILTHSKKITDEKAKEYRTALKPFLAEKSDDDMTFCAMGHAHIDLAWEWPARETIRKGGRTFASQMMNLERYPDTLFGEGQAQLYQWIKDGYPTLYQKSQEAHKAGRWELQGATWVEMDTNLISGESMLRQFYYGKEFFKKEFHEDVKVLWLPDTFGYSACLPQVMKLSGVDYFLTCRLGYNVAKKYPSVFRWKGLDGSEVLVHAIPDRYYNSAVTPYFLNEGKYRFTEKDICKKAVTLYGIGDGGGGPGFEHCERIARERNLKGIPKVEPKKVIDFFREIDRDGYRRCEGELYLEQFRGTYTTHSKVKCHNRKIEIALKNYEMLAFLCDGTDLPIPKKELDEIWKEALLYQFHDVLPGSAIDRVYQECEQRYDILRKRLDTAIFDLLDRLGGAVNLNPFTYHRKVKIGESWKELTLPPYGRCDLSALPIVTRFEAKSGKDYLENDKIKVTFRKGKIISLWDKVRQKELIPKGKAGNKFISYRDVGNCWTIRPRSYLLGYKAKAKCISFSTFCDGAEATAKAVYKVGKSTIVQKITLRDGEKTVQFDNTIDYREKKNILRLRFPIDLKADEANCNIAFGHIARSTHNKTKEEKAMFEVSCHKFVDLSDEEYGVSLLNDCKYGCRCKDGEMYLTLFRSPAGGPSHHVDRGEHTFSYALYLHDGVLDTSTYAKAYELNNPILFSKKEGTQKEFYRTDNENIVLESIQMLENGTALRFYNATASPQEAKLSFSDREPIAQVDLFGKVIAPFTEKITLPPFGLMNILVK